jgi:hypothetical protein
MLALLTALGDELSDGTFYWQELTREYLFNLSPTVTTYALPADFVRTIPGTQWDRTTRFPLNGPVTPQTWQWLKSWGVVASPLYQWRPIRDQFQITPAPGSATTDQMVLEYVSSQWIYDPIGVQYRDNFVIDSDVTVFDNRLMIAGLKMKFLRAKELPNGEATNEYNKAFEAAKGGDNGGKVLDISFTPAPYLLSDDNIPPQGYGS